MTPLLMSKRFASLTGSRIMRGEHLHILQVPSCNTEPRKYLGGPLEARRSGFSDSSSPECQPAAVHNRLREMSYGSGKEGEADQ